MYIDGIEYENGTFVAGGGFSDVYKIQTNPRNVFALKVPRHITGTPQQVREVLAVSHLLD